jgi:hypothetical protein
MSDTRGEHQKATKIIAFTEADNKPRPTQSQLILAYLEQGKTLTALSALRLFDSLSLAQRVHELRCKGHRIHSKIVKTKSGKRVAQYELVEGEGPQ